MVELTGQIEALKEKLLDDLAPCCCCIDGWMTPEELEEVREGYWGRPGSNQENKIRLLFAHIDAQAAQISLLKEKLVEIIADDLASIPVSHLRDKHEAQEWRDKARQRLAAEMRGVEWE